MTFRLDISAGEFFELVRPAVLVLSSLASIWVLAVARRHRFPIYLAIGWALGTVLFPLVTIPLFLIAWFTRRRSQYALEKAQASGTVTWSALQGRFVIPLIYAVVVLSLVASQLYREHYSFDGHLARAAYAKLHANRAATIEEYRAALKLKDDPHTRKLLAIELAEMGDWTGALFELRKAEQDGEIDDHMAFYIANLLESLNLPNQATLEFKRFLESRACTQPFPDERCAGASLRVQAAQATGRTR